MSKKINKIVDLIGMPEAVIFDTDNTLYPYHPAHNKAMRAVEQKVKKILGVEKEVFRIAFKNARDEIKDRLGRVASSHSRLLYMQRAIEILGLGTRILLVLDLEQTYWRTFLSNCELFPGVFDFIYLLKSKGIPTANITDLTAQIQFRKLVYFGLDELFNYVVTSEEAGMDKPDKSPFELAIRKLNCSPEKIIMIGDDLISDIQGAKNMGINAFQKIHQGSPHDKTSNIKPDFIFHNYSELIEMYNEP
jgi:FMN phosphatase YigB (HAD superfamily)